GATQDYLGNAHFTHGTLGIMPRSDIASSEVVLFAGRDPTSQRPITVAHLGVSAGGPYMKGPIFAMATYTTATRPPVSHVAVGSAIFNTNTKKLNVSDGTAWLDAIGAMATYTTATRPLPKDVAAGSAIFNTDTKKLNVSDGTA